VNGSYEDSDSVKRIEFPGHLSYYLLVKKNLHIESVKQSRTKLDFLVSLRRVKSRIRDEAQTEDQGCDNMLAGL
jgi:hypothetical protein